MKTTEKIQKLAEDMDPIVHQWHGTDEDGVFSGGWIRFKNDDDTGPVLADTRSQEYGDYFVVACNNAARMAEIIELTERILDRRYEIEGERSALRALIEAFQKGEQRG